MSSFQGNSVKEVLVFQREEETPLAILPSHLLFPIN
jgi:hypothetical protein